ncbi:VOC family protein [Algoriphagus sp.]|uniref:VOC family protein n=1 Tax=Algoriphagus sp. TaxID=1872435 RepID=UPI0025CDAE67|nr:VOC family protein [Algoriphagus sp.]
MNPNEYIQGLHHLTVSVGGAQEDIDFVTQVMGMRMIKQTVLFDGAASIYHLYYANADAEVGSVYTTFPFKKAGVYGKKGSGQIEVSGWSVHSDSLEFWKKHLDKHQVKNTGIVERFGQKMIHFEDPSGIGLGVFGDDSDTRNAWQTDQISKDNGIRGIYGTVLRCREIEMMDFYLREVLGFSKLGQDGDYHRYHIKNGGPSRVIELLHVPDLPQGSWTFGVGLPHHMAFATANDQQNAELKAYIEGFGFTDVTEIKDRNYFHSIYTRTPSGVLFEFATSDIGFAIDEPEDQLGHQLLLPPFFEDRRAEIVKPLEPITPPSYLQNGN